MTSGVQYPAQCKLGMVARVCKSFTQEVEAEVSGIQGPPWLHGELEDGTGSIRPRLIGSKRERRNKYLRAGMLASLLLPANLLLDG